ncbi:hypothetical protein Tco_1048246, partial [Tanacetum coccineum]
NVVADVDKVFRKSERFPSNVLPEIKRISSFLPNKGNNQLYMEVIKRNGKQIQQVVKFWVEQYEKDSKPAVVELFTMLFEACGATYRIQGEFLDKINKRLSETHEKITMIEDMMRKIFTGYYLFSISSSACALRSMLEWLQIHLALAGRGSIMYAVRCIRPDVAFAQNITSRFQQNPGEEHWTAVKNILKYLRNTKDMFLVYEGNMERELRVSCYTDVGYLTDADDLRSQTGYVFVLNGGAVN